MMNHRLIASIAVIAGAVACDPHRAEDSAVERFQFDARVTRPRIEIRLEEGSVRVTASDSRVVEAVLKRRARSVDRDAARGLLDRIRLQAEQKDDRIRIVGYLDSAPSGVLGGDLRVDVSLSVPREVDLDIRTDDGRVEIEGVRGDVVVESGDGRIVIGNLRGRASLRAQDGSIVGRDVEGDVDAFTDDGSIELEGRFGRLRAVSSDGRVRVDCRKDTQPTGEWLLRTSDGSIELGVPRSIAAELEARAADGTVSSSISSLGGRKRGGRLKGKLGRGGPLILVTTMDGHIELKESS